MEERLSIFTGGTAEIKAIQPYEQTGDQTSGQQRLVELATGPERCDRSRVSVLSFHSALSYHHFSVLTMSILGHSPIPLLLQREEKMSLR